MSLPVGYKQVEYIESTGIQYIDTLYKPNNNTRVDVRVKFRNAPTSHAGLFGARTAATEQFWCYYRYNDLGFATRFGNNADIKTGATSTVENDVSMDKNKLVVNGKTVNGSAQTFQSTYNMYLFSVNQSGELQYTSAFILYECKIYENDSIVRNFMPCVNANGAVGLFDEVSQMFYGNSGTGAFTAGQEIITDPDVLFFQGVRSVTIPEGNAVNVTRKSDGKVLWEV